MFYIIFNTLFDLKAVNKNKKYKSGAIYPEYLNLKIHKHFNRSKSNTKYKNL